MRDFTLLQREGRSYRYLGYLLKLTDAERILLSVLIDQPDAGHNAAVMAAICGFSTRSISAAVTSINRQALPICGHRLILSSPLAGYRLTDQL
jgi:hypothetical protein